MTTLDTTRNPFPFQGTLSIEGSRINARETTRSGVPTLMRDPIEQVLDAKSAYLARFKPNSRAQGQILMLKGPHGTGKTHALRYAIGRVTDETRATTATGVTEPHQIYVKAEGPDFVRLYQEAVTLVPFDLLRDLSLRFLGVMAREQLQARSGSAG